MMDCLQNAKSLTIFEDFVLKGQGLVVQGQGLVVQGRGLLNSSSTSTFHNDNKTVLLFVRLVDPCLIHASLLLVLYYYLAYDITFLSEDLVSLSCNIKFEISVTENLNFLYCKI